MKTPRLKDCGVADLLVVTPIGYTAGLMLKLRSSGNWENLFLN